MTKKSIFLYVLGIGLLALSFSYSLVYAQPYTGESKYSVTYLSENLITESDSLKTGKIIIKGNQSVSDIKITGDCGVYGKIVGKKSNYSIVQFGVNDTTCSQKNINLELEFDNKKFQKKINIISRKQLYTLHLDRSNKDIVNLISAIDTKISSHKLSDTDPIMKLKKERELAEYNYMRDFFKNLLQAREEAYKIPIIGASMPSLYNKVPNTGRPYRESYTDGIHHGWDFDADKGDGVVSLDDGLIVRVVDEYDYSDLGKIVKQADLSYRQKTENLDILRGKQVWIKTLKGDVAFYSHLDEIFSDIKEGDIVVRGQPIGTVGSTGVPDLAYTDFHLHIPIQKNPYIKSKVGKYTHYDYMTWDWYFKGESVDYVLKNQAKIFQP